MARLCAREREEERDGQREADRASMRVYTCVRARAWRQYGSREFACEIHSRSLSPVASLRRPAPCSLVCPYPPSLICGRFLTTPWAANSDVRLSTRGLARGPLRIRIGFTARTSSRAGRRRGDVYPAIARILWKTSHVSFCMRYVLLQ